MTKFILCLLALTASACAADLKADWYDTVERSKTLQAEGNYQESLKLLRAALQIASRIDPKGDLVAITLNNLGHLYQDLGQIPEALEAYNASRRIIVRQPAMPQPLRLANEINVVTLLLESGHGKAADKLWHRSLAKEVAHRAPGTPFHSELAVVGTAVHLARKRYADAESLITPFLAQYPKDATNLPKALALAARARARVGLGRTEDARADLRSALAVAESALGRTDHPLLARFYADAGCTFTDLHDNEEAEAYFRRALKIAEVMAGPQSLVHAAISLAFAKSLQDSHRKEEARALRQQVQQTYAPRGLGRTTLQELGGNKGWTR